jgi:hypothetical protein
MSWCIGHYLILIKNWRNYSGLDAFGAGAVPVNATPICDAPNAMSVLGQLIDSCSIFPRQLSEISIS